MFGWPIDARVKHWRYDAIIEHYNETISLVELEEHLTRRIGVDVRTSTCSVRVIDMPSDLQRYDKLVVFIYVSGDNGVTWKYATMYSGFISPDFMKYGSGIEKQIIGVDSSFLLTTAQFNYLYNAIETQDTRFDVYVTSILHLIRDMNQYTSDHFDFFKPFSLNLGSTYNISTLYTVRYQTGIQILNILNDLMAFAGTRMMTYDDHYTYIVSASTIPQAFSHIRYSVGDGTSIPPTDLGFYDMSRKYVGESLIASVRVTSPSLPDNSTVSAYVALPPEVIPLGMPVSHIDISNRFIQTIEQCQSIALRELRRRARIESQVEMIAPYHPDIYPGMTIMIYNPQIGYNKYTPGFVLSRAVNGDTMTVVLSMGPSLFPDVILNNPNSYSDFLQVDDIPLPEFDPSEIHYTAIRDRFLDPTPRGYVAVTYSSLPSVDMNLSEFGRLIPPRGLIGTMPTDEFLSIPCDTFPRNMYPTAEWDFFDVPTPWQPPFDFLPFAQPE
jgi:hypothetical protein